MKFVISANYKDRQSDYKWLVRPADLPPEDAVPAKWLNASGCAVAASSVYEAGFGCGVVVHAEEVYTEEPLLGKSPVPHPATMTRLKFDGTSRFYRSDDTDFRPVSKMDLLCLRADGSIWFAQRAESRWGDHLNLLSHQLYVASKNNGFWDEGEDRNKGEAIALIHSELSEALEAIRSGNKPSSKIPEFSGLEEEMADALIRILDFCGGFDLDISGAVAEKIKYNASRPRKHGKAF